MEAVSKIKTLQDVLLPHESAPSAEWQMRMVSSAECQSYVVWNTKFREAILVDPKLEDSASYDQVRKELSGYRWLAVIDTHTHADHISAAAHWAETLGVPLMMSSGCPSKRVHIRVSRDTSLPCQAAPLQFFQTPGHTPDSLCVLWGPFLMSGDTILFGDVGRDDLPGGDPAQHFESVQRLRAAVPSDTLVLPGHDNKGGRVTSWAKQLEVNPSLTQGREQFIEECAAFDGTAPALLKKSLFENFK